MDEAGQIAPVVPMLDRGERSLGVLAHLAAKLSAVCLAHPHQVRMLSHQTPPEAPSAAQVLAAGTGLHEATTARRGRAKEGMTYDSGDRRNECCWECRH